MEISVKTDIKAATKYLTAVQRKQIPYAASQALNDTAFDARKAVQMQMPRHIKKPTPWTIKGVMVDKSSKRRLVSSVLFADGKGKAGNRARYMKYQIAGGTRKPQRRAIPIPVGAKKNRYGNLPRGALKKLIADPQNFVGEINGVAGVWTRKNGRLLVYWADEAQYSPRFPMKKIVKGVTRSKFGKNFRRRMAAALRTAR